MKRLGLLALVGAALIAGFAGSMAKDWLIQPTPVQAQAQPVKIAILDFGRASRASKKFNAVKFEYEEFVKREKRESDRQVGELKGKQARLRALLQSGIESEEPNFLRPEIAAEEDYLKRNSKRQEAYLDKLMSEYQRQVIDEVRGEALKYCTTQGYHLCLQDFELEPGDDNELFIGLEYAQRWMTKPVLFAPGVTDKTNFYVKDITEDIINRVK